MFMIKVKELRTAEFNRIKKKISRIGKLQFRGSEPNEKQLIESLIKNIVAEAQKCLAVISSFSNFHFCFFPDSDIL